MSSQAQTRFWQRPVQPTPPVDLSTMKVYRRSAFPADAGPGPWLDQPDAQARIAERLAAGEINAEEAELCGKWSRDGYLILKGFYTRALIDQTWAEYEAAIAAGEAKPPAEPLYDGDPLPGRLLNVHFYVPAMDEMLHEPRMSHLMSVLLGAKVKPFQTIIGHKSSQQLEHSDSIHMTTYPGGYLAATWVAYEDIDPKSGPLIYYPGSHKLPYLLSEDVGMAPEAGASAYGTHYEPAVQRVIAEHGLKAERFMAQKGDVLLWHANLLHGGTRVEDSKLTRKALVCHFFAEGVVCYHDIVGTLSHTQLGYDLYQRRRPTAPARRGIVSRAMGALRRRLGG
jgi:phytanoyl-CoA dioxygenase PhyH